MSMILSMVYCIIKTSDSYSTFSISRYGRMFLLILFLSLDTYFCCHFTFLLLSVFLFLLLLLVVSVIARTFSELCSLDATVTQLMSKRRHLFDLFMVFPVCVYCLIFVEYYFFLQSCILFAGLLHQFFPEFPYLP